jgi:hypothetical protein
MGKTALFSNHQPGGMFAVEDESRGTGSRFFVQATAGTDRADLGRNPEAPLASLDYAIGLCTAAKGDIIYLMEGHAETTTAIAMDVAGVRVVGLGTGRNRPALTATAAATDLINVTAANCAIENVRLVGAASAVTALLDIAADDFRGERIVFEHGATPLSAVTVPGSWSRGQLIDCMWRGTAAGPDYCIYFENGATTGTIKDWQIIRPRAQYSVSAGLDNAFIRADRKCPGLIITDPVVIGFDTLAVDINSSTIAVGDGVISNGVFIASTTLTSIEDAFDVGGMVFDNCRVSDDASKRTGLAPISSAS